MAGSQAFFSLFCGTESSEEDTRWQEQWPKRLLEASRTCSANLSRFCSSLLHLERVGCGAEQGHIAGRRQLEPAADWEGAELPGPLPSAEGVSTPLTPVPASLTCRSPPLLRQARPLALKKTILTFHWLTLAVEALVHFHWLPQPSRHLTTPTYPAAPSERWGREIYRGRGRKSRAASPGGPPHPHPSCGPRPAHWPEAPPPAWPGPAPPSREGGDQAAAAVAGICWKPAGGRPGGAEGTVPAAKLAPRRQDGWGGPRAAGARERWRPFGSTSSASS